MAGVTELTINQFAVLEAQFGQQQLPTTGSPIVTFTLANDGSNNVTLTIQQNFTPAVINTDQQTVPLPDNKFYSVYNLNKNVCLDNNPLNITTALLNDTKTSVTINSNVLTTASTKGRLGLATKAELEEIISYLSSILQTLK